MINYLEILRLNHLGYSQRTIETTAHYSRHTVREVLAEMDKHGIQWPVDDDIFIANRHDCPLLGISCSLTYKMSWSSIAHRPCWKPYIRELRLGSQCYLYGFWRLFGTFQRRPQMGLVMFAVSALKSVCHWGPAHFLIMLAHGGSRWNN